MALVKLNKTLHLDDVRIQAPAVVDLDDLDLDEAAEKELEAHGAWTRLTQEETEFYEWQQNGGKNQESAGVAVKEELGAENGLGTNDYLSLEQGESGSADPQSEGETGGKRPSKNKPAVDETQSGSEDGK